MTKPNDLYGITEHTIFARELRKYIKACKDNQATKQQIKHTLSSMVEEFY